MCSWNAIRELLVAIAAGGLLMPPSFVAAQTPAIANEAPVMEPTAKDVALDDGGFLQGVVVDETGAPQSGVLVYIVNGGAIVGSTGTQATGEFQLKLDRGGQYNLLVGNRALQLRCWAASTAPPSAPERMMITVDDVYRGQIHPAACGLGNAWVIAGLVTAAIVIPVVLHNNRDDRESSS